MRNHLARIAAAALLLGLALAPAKAQQPVTAHVGANVIFVHYHWGYEGQLRAATLLTEPGECPPDMPGGLTGCANLRFWTTGPGETENPTGVKNADGSPSGMYTNQGDDWRCCVPHDPTGKTPRSWHLWGEAPGEQ